jgi:nitronate monooxygenase
MGTRFLASKEVHLHPKVKNRLKELQETDTILVKKSIGKTARVMRTQRAEELLKLEESGAAFEDIFPYISGEAYYDLIANGNDQSGVISLGQTVGLIEEIKSAEEIIRDIVREYSHQLETLYRLSNRSVAGRQ